ncbi:MAG: HAMP domain-containing histidine kinase [Acidobacteriota bacterium]|nr:HAMP domain-containing histidine kinase [Acidobacteriota bacterium]MDH3784460.1 HAMP domain-containing histidine kinase [Acidobacteriota bacterium]
MSRAARWWVVFGACNVIVALALIWTTRVVVDLERRELAARAETDYQQSLRLAMWRMDSWLAVLFAREAARPSSDYLSPDLESDFVELRFEIDAQGLAASAQESLDTYRGYLDPNAVHLAFSATDGLVETKLADPQQDPSQLVKTQNEFDARLACGVPRPPGEDLAGRQVVAWLEPPAPQSEPALAFLRRTELDGADRIQGFILAWPRLHDRLLLEIDDLFPDARLERVASNEPTDPLGRGLANIPVKMVAAAQPVLPTTGFTAGRTALTVAWLAAIVAAIVVGATLRKSIDLGERRRRFVSAVTHELRTPLTTFQMYSEMLADGLVTTEEQRRQYLQTLKDESQRLSAMVSNVLTHARLEERGGSRQFESMTLNALLTRLKPPLERSVESTPMTLCLDVDGPDDIPLSVNAEAIGQILGNLVDNAAKYANGTTSPTIRLSAAAKNGSLVMTVRDHGPGIPREQVRVVFDPFERGGRDPADPVPGVGLGLALARGLARDLGGELTLESPSDGGARFRLELPTVAET